LVLWDQYFLITLRSPKRISFSFMPAAIVMICTWIVHIYAAIWVRGTPPWCAVPSPVAGPGVTIANGLELVGGKSGGRGTGAKPAK
jgi:hypothetical protein